MYPYRCGKCGFKFELSMKIYNTKVYQCPKCWRPGVRYLGFRYPKIAKGLNISIREKLNGANNQNFNGPIGGLSYLN
jgi:hypothetical protein